MVTINNHKFLWSVLLVILVLAATAGCTAQRSYRVGQDLVRQGDYDGAVVKYMDAVTRNPESREYRLRLDETLVKAAVKHFEVGKKLAADGKRGEALAELRRAQEYDRSLVVIDQEIKRVEELLKADRLVEQAEEFVRTRRLQQAKNRLDEALLIDPEHAAARTLLDKLKSERRAIIDGIELDVTSDKPITLKFKETSVKDAFSILTRLSGINFILDDEIKAPSFSLSVEDLSFPQALELILQMNKLGKKVLNTRTIIIYPKTKDKDKQFEDQIIQTFYLSNIDAKKAVNLLRTMLQLRKVYVHEELNALVIRDTPEVIKLAGKMLEASDRADAEVTFDLELIEVNHSDKLDFGPKLSKYSIGGGFGKGGKIVSDTLAVGGDTGLLLQGAGELKVLDSFISIPALTFDFLKTQGETEVLANPKIRVRNKEKAKVHIGSREPVLTVTKTGTNDFTENVQYQDVGVKLEVEPNVQLDDTVVTKLTLEVSSVSERTKTNNNSIYFTITTTNAQTSLTLKDNERTIIGGLIRDFKSNTRSSIPFLGDIPLLGDLLSSTSKEKVKREILLSITPHIVQNLVVPGADSATIWSGGEDEPKMGPNFGAFAADSFLPVTDQPPQVVVPAFTKGAAVAATVPVAEPDGLQAEPSPVATVATAEKQSETAVGVLQSAEGVSLVAPSTTGDAAVTPAILPGQTPPAPSTGTTPPSGSKVEIPPFEVPPVIDGRLTINGPESAAVGQSVAFEVRATAMNGLFSAPLFVIFDSERLEFVKAEEGDFLRQGGATTVFTTSTMPARGQLIVGYKQGVGSSGASGDGLLFRLIFRAKSAGTTELKLDRLNFRNSAGTRLKVETLGRQLEVRQGGG